MEINKQKFAAVVGILIFILHIAVSFFFHGFYHPPADGIAIANITTPITLGYAMTIFKWFIDTQGLVTSDDVIGLSYALIVSILVLALSVGLLTEPVLYLLNDTNSRNPEFLNQSYMIIESVFGVLLSLVLLDLFGVQKKKKS